MTDHTTEGLQAVLQDAEHTLDGIVQIREDRSDIQTAVRDMMQAYG